MNISVLGCGRWGSFISWYANSLGHNVKLWGRVTSDSYTTLLQNRANEYVVINDNIELTSDISNAVNSAEIIIISISAQSLREFAQLVNLNDINKSATIILCMKGLEADTCMRLTEVCIASGISKSRLAVWLGPGHIQDFTRGIPNCMVIDSYSTDLTENLSQLFNSELIRFYYGHDIIGNEIGGAAKNVIGICAGMLDGMNYTTLKGPLMSRGTNEIARIIAAMGGNPQSAYGLAHLGDYETTLFSEFSNNRRFGEQFIRGLKYSKLAEGVATTKALHNYTVKYDIDAPIISTLYNILFNKLDPNAGLTSLFNRTQKYDR